MAQIREIKRRIKSINNTSKVTHAMELVSAAKMRRAQDQALASRPYTINLTQILAEVRTKTPKVTNSLLTSSDIKSELIILLTTDRGLVGGLNLNLFRLISNDHSQSEPGSTNAHSGSVARQFVIVGKKGINFGSKSGSNLIATFQSEEKSALDLARTITKMAIDSYIAKEVGTVKIVYPDYQSTIKQVPTITQILPIELEQDPEVHSRSGAEGSPGLHSGSVAMDDNLLFEPSAESILDSILPHYVLTCVYQTILEAKASEHSARMVAMKNATDAANDLVSDLTLTYNQARQEAITTELLDIVTAQSAFE